jgi:hypothetical protein
MPRETIDIPVYKALPAEGMSQLMAYVAYPDNLDAVKRQRFATALWRMAIQYKADTDKSWASKPQMIKPMILLDDDKVVFDSLKRGLKLLWRHWATAYYFLLPHFIKQSSGRLPHLSEVNSSFEKQQPTVENLSLALKGLFGWEGSDIATFKDKVWRHTKPVAHLAYALASWQFTLSMEREELRERTTSSAFFDMFFDDDVIVYMKLAETYRKKATSIKQFKIKEDQTIQFQAV